MLGRLFSSQAIRARTPLPPLARAAAELLPRRAPLFAPPHLSALRFSSSAAAEEPARLVITERCAKVRTHTARPPKACARAF